MDRNHKAILAAVIVVLVFYVGSYTRLSSQGQYVPFDWGLDWVKSYMWAPRSFVSGPEGIKPKRFTQVLYLPLWYLDMRFVHKSDDAGNGKYPINRLLDTELQKGFKDFEQNQTAHRTGASLSAQETNRTSSAGVRR
jgi:hypothetical protein